MARSCFNELRDWFKKMPPFLNKSKGCASLHLGPRSCIGEIWLVQLIFWVHIATFSLVIRSESVNNRDILERFFPPLAPASYGCFEMWLARLTLYVEFDWLRNPALYSLPNIGGSGNQSWLARTGFPPPHPWHQLYQVASRCAWSFDFLRAF